MLIASMSMVCQPSRGSRSGRCSRASMTRFYSLLSDAAAIRSAICLDFVTSRTRARRHTDCTIGVMGVKALFGWGISSERRRVCSFTLADSVEQLTLTEFQTREEGRKETRPKCGRSFPSRKRHAARFRDGSAPSAPARPAPSFENSGVAGPPELARRLLGLSSRVARLRRGRHAANGHDYVP